MLLAAALTALTIGYMLPSAVAIVKQKKNGTAIFFLNLLLGWTFIGWVAALIWALLEDKN